MEYAFDAALNPPAVEHAETGHAVQCGLHSAGAAGLHRRQRGVEPQVHAGGEEGSQLSVVIFQVNDAHLRAE